MDVAYGKTFPAGSLLLDALRQSFAFKDRVGYVAS